MLKLVWPRANRSVRTRELSRSVAYMVIEGTSWLGNTMAPSIEPASTPAHGPSDITAASDKRARNGYPKAATLHGSNLNSLAKRIIDCTAAPISVRMLIA